MVVDASQGDRKKPMAQVVLESMTHSGGYLFLVSFEGFDVSFDIKTGIGF